MSTEVKLGSSIPVLRMLDEVVSRQFYVEFLGYTIDWEHRFIPDDSNSPLYMQIHRDDSVLHLNGHANSDSPIAEVRVPVVNLEMFCDQLREKCRGNTEQPELVDPRYEGRNTDMNLYDPSGNLLVFWSPSDMAIG